jgi:hypothetical protein
MERGSRHRACSASDNVASSVYVLRTCDRLQCLGTRKRCRRLELRENVFSGLSGVVLDELEDIIARLNIEKRLRLGKKTEEGTADISVDRSSRQYELRTPCVVFCRKQSDTLPTQKHIVSAPTYDQQIRPIEQGSYAIA